jgi:hypothetical protein
VGEQCGAAPRQINLRALVKAYVTAFEAYDDLAKSIVAVALGETPCIGKMRLLCRRGALSGEVLDAILNPYRLSVELPPAAAEGLGQYAGKRAKDVDERGWIEVLSYTTPPSAEEEWISDLSKTTYCKPPRGTDH